MKYKAVIKVKLRSDQNFSDCRSIQREGKREREKEQKEGKRK